MRVEPPVQYDAESAIFAIWGLFALYWLVSAFGAKHGSRSPRVRPPSLTLLIGVLLERVFVASSAPRSRQTCTC